MKFYNFREKREMLSPIYVALVFCMLLVCLLVCSGASSDSTALLGLAGALVLAYVLVGPAKSELAEDQLHEAMPQCRWEWLGLVLVLCVGVFFRFYRLSEIPPGIFLDMGYDGWCSRLVIQDHFRFHGNVCGPFPSSTVLSYLLAGWFTLFRADVLNHAVIFSLISSCTLLVFYGIFRMISGSAVGLLGVFFLSAMRWHFSAGRGAFSSSIALFFIGLGLFFFLKSLRNKGWFYPLGFGLWMGLGFGVYQSFKVVPLWMLWVVFYERSRDQKTFRGMQAKLLGAVLLFLALVSPALQEWLQRGTLGRRESELFIFSNLHGPNTVTYLLDHMSSYLMMFYRMGDSSPQHNIPFERMIDEVTGILFLIGLVFYFRNHRLRRSYYVLTALVVLTLPGLLSSDSIHSIRILSITPWVALVAGEGWILMWNCAHQINNTVLKYSWIVLLILGLGLTALLNGNLYFNTWASDVRVWKDHSVPETEAAVAVMRSDPNTQFRVASRFMNHFTFKFLAFERLKNCAVLEPDSFLRPPVNSRVNVQYVLEPEQGQYRWTLENAFPSSRETVLRYPWGEPIVYWVDVPSESWKFVSATRTGFKARWYINDQNENKIFLERTELILNYTNGNDFPLIPSGINGQLWGDWIGAFKTAGNERSRIFISSMDIVEVNVDAKGWRPFVGDENYDLDLPTGKHKIEIRYFINRVWNNHLKLQIQSVSKDFKTREIMVEPGE